MYAEESSNHASVNIFGVFEFNIQLQRKKKKKDLKKCFKSKQAFLGPKMRRFHQIDDGLEEFVKQEGNSELTGTSEVLKIKVLQFNGSLDF